MAVCGVVCLTGRCTYPSPALHHIQQPGSVTNVTHNAPFNMTINVHIQKRATNHSTTRWRDETGVTDLHVSVVDERPAPRSLQRIVKEILEFPIAGVLFGRSGSGSAGRYAGPGSAEDPGPLSAVRSRNEQRPIPVGFRSPGVQTHKAHFVLLLSGLSWVDPAVESLLHHSSAELSVPSPPRGSSITTALSVRGVCWVCVSAGPATKTTARDCTALLPPPARLLPAALRTAGRECSRFLLSFNLQRTSAAQ